MTRGARHRNLVQAVKQRTDGQCRGFTKAVLKVMGIDRSRYDQTALRYRREAPCVDGGFPLPAGFTPDVFRIKPQEEEVICYEIESTAWIDASRLVPYVEWFWFLDDQGWRLRLFIIRPYSSHGVSAELNLLGISATWHIESSVHVVGSLGVEAPKQESSLCAPC